MVVLMGKVTIVTVVVVRESLLEWQTLNWMLYWAMSLILTLVLCSRRSPC